MADQSPNSNDPEQQNTSHLEGDVQPNYDSPHALMARQLIHQAVQTLEPSDNQDVDQIMQQMLNAFDVSNWIRWFSPLGHYMTKSMETILRNVCEKSRIQASRLRMMIQARTKSRRPSNEASQGSNQEPSESSPELIIAQEVSETDALLQQLSSSSHSPACDRSSQDPPEAVEDCPMILDTSNAKSGDCDGYCMIIAFPWKSQELIQKTTDILRNNDPMREQTKSASEPEQRNSSAAPEIPKLISKRSGSPSSKEPPAKKRAQTESSQPKVTKTAPRKSVSSSSLGKFTILNRPKRK